MVAPADNTLVAIRKRIRRLTASVGESTLKTADIDQYINTYYNNDFPYSIKLDQMRSVYSFFTSPNIGRYPLDVNYNQGIRAPVYFEGIKGHFFKDREQFYNMWPRWPTLFQPISGDGVTTSFAFTVGAVPILPESFVLGGTATSGASIQVNDNGNGILYLETPNAQISVPSETAVYTAANAPTPALIGKPVAGMKNLNTDNPGNNLLTQVGTVNYVTGAVSIDFSLGGVVPVAGKTMSLWVNQYQVGRPYTLLFWNNEFRVRPVPDKVYKVEIETYLTPVQFMETTDTPILSQWWQLIAMGAAIKVLEDRQDMDGVANLTQMFMKQEAITLERQAIEEIGQRNTTLFTQIVEGPSYGS